MASVRIYTTSTCGYCYAAKDLLREKGVSFEEIDVSGDHAKRAWLREVTGRRTVPQIFIGGRSVGGFTDIAALDRAGELRSAARDLSVPRSSLRSVNVLVARSLRFTPRSKAVD